MLIYAKMPTVVGILTFISMMDTVKMPTVVGILTFISMIYTTSESLIARKIYIFQHYSYHELLKFHAQFS